MSDEKQLTLYEDLGDLYDPSDAADAVATAQSQDGWPMLRIMDRSFHYDGAEVGPQMSVVILASTPENIFYDTAFDPSDPQPPACRAVAQLGQSAKEMGPGPDGLAPSCSVCPNNEWGSGRGKGKACSNYMRIALLPESALSGGIPTPALARIAPTSVKSFERYVKTLAAMDTPLAPQHVVTQVRLGKGLGNSPFGWEFAADRGLKRAEFAQVKQNWIPQAQAELMRAPSTSNEEE